MKRVIAWSLAIFVFAVFVLFRLDFALTHPRHDADFASDHGAERDTSGSHIGVSG